MQENDENITGNWRKGISCYIVPESLATRSFRVLQKVEKIPNESGDVAKEILVRAFVLPAFSTCKKRDKIEKKKKSIKMEKELTHLEDYKCL